MLKNRNAHLLAHARRLMDLGCPLNLEFFQESQDGGSRALRIKQVGGVTESRVFDIEPRGMGCALDLEIVNDTGRPIYLRDFELKFPWSNPLFCLLSDSRRCDEEPEMYRFTGTNLEYPKSLVLNWLVKSSRRLTNGGLVAGLVLYQGPLGIPEEYKHGEQLDVNFSVLDQFDAVHSAEVTLYVDRSAN